MTGKPKQPESQIAGTIGKSGWSLRQYIDGTMHAALAAMRIKFAPSIMEKYINATGLQYISASYARWTSSLICYKIAYFFKYQEEREISFFQNRNGVFKCQIQGESGVAARFLKLPPASAVSPIMTKFSQYTPHSTCYLVLVSICWQD